MVALQKSLYYNAVQGFIFSLSFTFVVLLAMTSNIIITIFSVISITGILGNILASMKIMGWEMGLSESLAMIVFVGLSVDYVVHVSHNYVESVHHRRRLRMDDSYKTIGSAVISSAITTFSAGVFLLFTNLYILYKFGVLIMITMALSCYYALIFLPATLYIFGPEYHQGDLKHYCCKPIWRCISGQKKEDDDEDMVDYGDEEEDDKPKRVFNGEEEDDHEDLENDKTGTKVGSDWGSSDGAGSDDSEQKQSGTNTNVIRKKKLGIQ